MATERLETSITIEYRNNWGIRRIVMDAISNHLPSDSKGKARILFKQDGNYVDFKEADDKPIEEIVFEDDGTGYNYPYLRYLYSTKKDNLSVGQFGEGIKLLSTACLREGIDIEMQSRNWRAKPTSIKDDIEDNITVESLCFDVDIAEGDSIIGSKTIFHNPQEELIREVKKIEDNVLYFNDTYKELYKDNKSRIIDILKPEKSLFIKEQKIININSIFSYDLSINEISPDRDTFKREIALSSIKQLLQNCTDKDIIKTIIKAAEEERYKGYIEFEAFGDPYGYRIEIEYDSDYGLSKYMPEGLFSNPYDKLRDVRELPYSPNMTYISQELIKTYYDVSEVLYTNACQTNKNLWAQCFHELFGEDAVIASDSTTRNEDVAEVDLRPIYINQNIGKYLAKCGVQEADKVDLRTEYKWVDYNNLNEDEKFIYSTFESGIELFFGEKIDIEVRIYDGVFLKSGRELKSDLGVAITEHNGTKYVGIRRDMLKKPVDAIEILYHESVHDQTGYSDNTREFTRVFIRKLAERDAPILMAKTLQKAQDEKIEKDAWIAYT